MPTGRPKRQGERTWDEYRVSRSGVAEALKTLKSGGSAGPAFIVFASYIVPHLATPAAFMDAISSSSKKNMILDSGSYLLNDTSATGVLCEVEFSAIQKGSQGLFWVPTGKCRVISTVYDRF